MAMQIQGNYDHSGVDYAERVKEKQAAERAEKAAEEKNSGRLSEPKDEYVSSEKSGQKPTGLYRLGQDEKGNRKLFFDDPKAGYAKEQENRSEKSEDGKAPKVGGDSQGSRRRNVSQIRIRLTGSSRS